MSTKQTTKSLTDEQEQKLIRLLKQVESATEPLKAVWLPEEQREEIKAIRETIEE